MICRKCKEEVTHYFMCDKWQGEFCETCFDHERCEEEHGEGCSTHVFEEKSK